LGTATATKENGKEAVSAMPVGAEDDLQARLDNLRKD
jgi:hypothetical protein